MASCWPLVLFCICQCCSSACIHAHISPARDRVASNLPALCLLLRGGGSGRAIGSDALARGKGRGKQTPRDDSALQNAAPSTNQDFIAYYREQGIVPPAEWDSFMAALATPLPPTFRMCGAQAAADKALATLKRLALNASDTISLRHLALLSQEYHASRGGTGWGDHQLPAAPADPPPQPPPEPDTGGGGCVQVREITWLPGAGAYQLQTPVDSDLKKDPACASLREALVNLSDAASLSRQVSVCTHVCLYTPTHVCVCMRAYTCGRRETLANLPPTQLR